MNLEIKKDLKPNIDPQTTSGQPRLFSTCDYPIPNKFLIAYV